MLTSHLVTSPDYEPTGDQSKALYPEDETLAGVGPETTGQTGDQTL